MQHKQVNENLNLRDKKYFCPTIFLLEIIILMNSNWNSVYHVQASLS